MNARATLRILSVTTVFAASLLLSSCSSGSGAASTTTTTTTGTPNAYTAAYKSLSWGSGVTVTYPSACQMNVASNGVPAYHDAYYLGPVSAQYPTQIASTASGLKLALVPYTASAVVTSSATFNICPTKAATTTASNLGPIGYIVSGEFLYNAFEATQTPALGDNISYSYTINGVSGTAYFIDNCNSHATPLTMGYTWHYHGVPTCVTTATDGASGASHIVGIALDGFPVYGGRDISGNVINVSQLDACNGITSPTPEFPNGAYHYVLPIGVTNKSSSLNCYAGTVNATVVAAMERLACKMRNRQTVDPKKEHEYLMKMAAMGM